MNTSLLANEFELIFQNFQINSFILLFVFLTNSETSFQQLLSLQNHEA